MIPQFEILSRIGGGSYGEVFLARSVTGTYRAVKIVRREDFERDKTFEREFEGIKRYEKVSQDHAGLVDVLHVGRNDEKGFYYYVMELADDIESGSEIDVEDYEPRTLSSDLKQNRQRPVAECVEVGASLAEALGHLHAAGLTHRDVKPSNVIFVKGVPKLADVGLVARSGQRTFVGTEGYVPPEGPGTAAADLYSLAMVLYEMGTGKDRLDFPELPTNLELPPTVNRDEWRALNTVICRAGAPDPRKRTESGEVLARQLREVTATDEVSGGHWKGWAAACLVVATAGAMAYGAYQHFSSDNGDDKGKGAQIAGAGAGTAGIDPLPNGDTPIPGPDIPNTNGGEPNPLAANDTDPVGAFSNFDPFELPESIRNPIAGGGSISTGFNGDGPGNGEVVIKDFVGPPEPPAYPPAPPKPVEARLKITQPPGAAVWNGEEQIDVTPTGWLKFEPGPIRLVLRKTGYLDYPYENDLVDGRTLEGSIEMKVDRRPVIGQSWTNSLGIEFEAVGSRHICEEIRRDLFDRFIEEENYPFSSVRPANAGAAAEDAAFADDRAMWAFCDWMTEKDRESGYLGSEQYHVAQRFSTEGDVQAFLCRIENRFGQIALNSDPPGAEIHRHGKFIGKAPLSLSHQRMGRHEFVMKLPGHRETPGVVEVIEGEVIPLTVELERDNSVLFGEPWVNSLGMRFVPMGEHLEVAIWETRVQDFAEFLKSRPEGVDPPKPGFAQEPTHPVAGVNVNDARRFCEWLTQEERSRGLIRSNQEYRLPTDREWSRMTNLPDEEGTTPGERDRRQVSDHFPWGTEWPPPEGSGNFADQSAIKTADGGIIRNYDDGFPATAPVGSFKPNPLGLYDLAGNVWEWVDDPYGPNTSLIGVRGGGWASSKEANLLTTYRNAKPPTMRDNLSGFRIVLADSLKEKRKRESD